MKLTSLNRCISLCDVPGHAGQKRDPMLSGGDRVRRRRVNDKTSKLRGGAQIHVVDPNTSASNNLEPTARRLEHLTSNLGPAPNDQRVTERDLSVELLGSQVVRAVHIREILQELHTSLTELLGDEDRRLGSVSGCARHENETAARSGESDGSGGWERRSGGEGQALEGLGGDGDRGGCGG